MKWLLAFGLLWPVGGVRGANPHGNPGENSVGSKAQQFRESQELQMRVAESNQSALAWENEASELNKLFESADEILEKARRSPRRVTREEAKSQNIFSNYLSEFLSQYLADVESCFRNHPVQTEGPWPAALRDDQNKLKWPLDEARKAHELTREEIEKALGSPKFQIRQTASFYLNFHLKEVQARLLSLLKSTSDPEVKKRIESLIAPYVQRLKIRECMKKAAEKYASQLVREAHPDATVAGCAVQDEGTK